MGRCPLSCALSNQSLSDLSEIITLKKQMECNFHGNLEADITSFAVRLCPVNGKCRSLHKSQLFSLECKLGPNIFCRIKDANNQSYFLSSTTMHKDFRRIWAITQISSQAGWLKLSLYKSTHNSKWHIDFIPAWPSEITEQVHHLTFQMFFPFYILKILLTHS